MLRHEVVRLLASQRGRTASALAHELRVSWAPGRRDGVDAHRQRPMGRAAGAAQAAAVGRAARERPPGCAGVLCGLRYTGYTHGAAARHEVARQSRMVNDLVHP
ncbi:MAG: hypothetical protein QOD83_2312 [Solirubrobacteraceae bacterium]|jgi:hypothetical protein|nr:hypothetical protein [Solirubrobacteraceae bacterium]